MSSPENEMATQDAVPESSGAGPITWSARPSFRQFAVGGLLMGGLGYFFSSKAGPVFQVVINATADSVMWTDELILNIYHGLQVASYIPLAVVGMMFLRALSVKYEISEGRFLMHRGILVRRHDQIALQRVRDFRVFRPLGLTLLGIGRVHLVSRDETYPELTIGPFSDPLDVERIIHAAVLEQQQKVGFREFEST